VERTEINKIWRTTIIFW